MSKGAMNLTKVWKTLEWHHLVKKMTRGSKITKFETVSFMDCPLRLPGAQSKLLALIRISKFSCLTVGPLPFSCLKPTDFKCKKRVKRLQREMKPWLGCRKGDLKRFRKVSQI